MTVITRQVLRTQHLAPFTTQPSIAAGRPFSTSRASWEARAESKLTTTNKPHTVDPRWLTLMKRRIGKCMMFGLKTPQVQEAGEVLQQLARDWRELVAGSEGFLTNDIVRGLFRHNVTWGEMVCIYGISLSLVIWVADDLFFSLALGYHGKSGKTVPLSASFAHG